jgi:hypothetical protein
MPKEIFLQSLTANRMVQFVPAHDSVAVITMEISNGGGYSQHLPSTVRATMTLEAGRREYTRLRRAGYTA